MKKKTLLYLFVVVSIFTITGCGKEEKNGTGAKQTTQSATAAAVERVNFTVDSNHNHVNYKLPEGGESGFFNDLGHSCNVSYYTNQTSVAALYPFDDKVDKIDKVTINDFNYETYKYVDNLGVTYVYRTKVNNDYHLFTYYCANKEYEDSQVEKFMDTVEYVYDSITYKQD